MNKNNLIQLLAQQIQHAVGLDGKLGPDAVNERREACNAANATIDKLTQLGMEAEEAFEAAEALIA
jgi:hypothetical protein